MSMVEQFAEEDPGQESEMSATPSVERKTAEDVGAERLEAMGAKFNSAKEWLTNGFKATGEKVKQGWSFLKRLGKNIMGADQAIKNVATDAGQAVGDFAKKDYAQTAEHVGMARDAVVGAGVAVGGASVEAYRFVSEKVRQGAEAAGNRATEAWNRMVEAKNRAIEWGRDRMDDVCEAGRAARDGIVGKIQDAKIAMETRRVLAEAASRDRAAEQHETGADADEILIQRLEARIGFRRELAANLRQQAQELRSGVSGTNNPAENASEVNTGEANA